MGDSVANVSLGLEFDGASIQKSINSTISKVKSSIDNSTKGISDNISKNTKKAVDDSVKSLNQLDEKINKILNDTSRSDKSKAMSIASVLQKDEGLDKSASIIKAYDIVGRKAKEAGDKVSASTDKVSKKTNRFFSLFKRNTDKAKRQAEGVGNSLNVGVGGALAKLGKLAIAAFSIRAIANFGKECVELGSNLSEVQNVVDSTFTTMSEKVNEFSKTSITRLGMSETTYKKMVGTMGAMSKSFGFTEAEALKMADSITALTADVASFYNLSHDEAYTKMKSIYTGETESLKELGVVMTQAALDEFALANGFGKTTKAMTEQEKVALRYQFVMKQLQTASGDFMRTSDGWANQTRILSENFNRLKATIGQGLINALLPVIRVLNVLLEKLQVVGDAFSNLTAKIFGKAESKNGTGAISTSLEGITAGAENAGSAIEGIGDSASAAAEKMQKSVMGFDELNTLQAPMDSSGGGASGAGAIGGGISEQAKEQDKLNNEIKEEETLLDKAIKRAKELANIFKDGFKLGLDNTGFNTAIEGMKNSAKSIKESFINIFGDGKILNAFNSLIDNIVYTAGSIVGNIVGIGASIVNALTGGVAKYLEENSSFIKEKILNIIGLFDKIVTNVRNIFNDISEIITDVFNSDNFQELIAECIEFIVNPFLELKEFFLTIYNDLLTGVSEFITRYKDTFSQGLIELSGLLATIVGGITDIIMSVINMFEEGYNEHIRPVLEYIQTKLYELMDNYLIPLGNTFMECCQKIWENIEILWKEFLEPFVAWFVDAFMSDLAEIIKGLADLVFDVVSRISVILEGLLLVLSGIIEFLVGVFTGDWNKAWNGIKETCSGIIKTIEGIIGTSLEQIWNNIVQYVSNLPTEIGRWLGETLAKIVQFFASIPAKFEDFKSTMKQKWDDFWNGVIEKFNSMKEVIPSKINEIIDIIKNIDLFEIGRNMMDGLKNGLSSAWQSVKDTVSGFTSGIKEGFTEAMDIHSPSRWMRDFIAGNMMKGLEIGISTNADDVLSSLNSFRGNMSSILEGPIQAPKLAFTGSSEYDTSNSYNETNNSNPLLLEIQEQNRQLKELVLLTMKLLDKNQDIYMDKDKVGTLLTNYQYSENRRNG